MQLLLYLTVATMAAAAGNYSSSEPSKDIPALPSLRLCSDVSVIRADEKCLPRLHSSKTDYGIRPEVTLVISCGAPPRMTTEELIENTLYKGGFDVLNARRAGPDIGETFTRGMTIYAIDGQSMVWVSGAPTIHRPPDPFFVSVMLISRPPTAAAQRLKRNLSILAAQLEQDSCKLVKNESAENGPDSAGTYDTLAFYVRHSLEEAQRKAPSSKAFKVHRP
ncbi:hypothetical protein V6R86_13220 [Sphingomonas kaistensis]|uniref:Uncharacterized protein n=1 Tax=Sphingomonas kaistensis TaxID=298708 RepID=A0ABZ2G5Z5_9SPHN